MITTIIFDIGNVLVDFGWEAYYKSFGFPEDIFERAVKATVASPAWDEFDRGAKSDEELIAAFVANDPGLEKEIRLLCEDIHDMLSMKDYAISWIQELKSKGFKVYYLSNFSRKAENECADSLAFIPYTDGGILSYKEKMVKPEPEIYQLLIDRYSLEPAECIFFDDKLENCEAAKQVGMNAFQFTTKEAAIEALKEFGVY